MISSFWDVVAASQHLVQACDACIDLSLDELLADVVGLLQCGRRKSSPWIGSALQRPQTTDSVSWEMCSRISSSWCFPDSIGGSR